MLDRPRVRTLLPTITMTVAAGFMVSTTNAQPCHRWEVVEYWVHPICEPLVGIELTRVPRGMNTAGDIVGSQQCFIGPNRPFLIRDGVIQVLDHPAFTEAWAMGVTDDGTVVGSAAGVNGHVSVGFLWKDGVFTFVEPEPPLRSALYFNAVTPDGIIVGTGDHPNYIVPTPIRTRVDDLTIDVIGLDIHPKRRSEVRGIDVTGAIGGGIRTTVPPTVWHPLVEWNLENFTELPLPEDAERGIVAGVNTPIGIATGSYRPSDPDAEGRPIMWREDGSYQVLPDLPGSSDGYVKYALSDRFLVGQADVLLGGGPASVIEGVAWVDGEAVSISDDMVDFIASTAAAPTTMLPDGRFCSSSWFLDPISDDWMLATFLYAPRPATTGDVNCDSRVDFRDLLKLIAHWGPCDACGYDLDADGEVRHSDLLLLFEHWSE